MEVIGFTLGVLASVEQAITTADALKKRYEAFRQNPKDVHRLLKSYQSFAADLHAMDGQFRGKLCRIPPTNRRIFERHFSEMVESFDSARERLDEVSEKLAKGRFLRMLHAKAQAEVCGELLGEMQRVERLLFDINSFLATADIIDSVKEEIRPDSDIDRFRSFFPVLTASPDLILDFDAVDEQGNPATCEGRVKRLILSDSDNRGLVALHGMGGVGKSVLLRNLTLDTDVRQYFADGIHLIKLGVEATHATAIRELLNAVSDAGGSLTVKKLQTEKSLDAIVRSVVAWFHSRHCVFLVDDLWPANHLGSSFLAQLASMIGRQGQIRIVVSTRDLEIASQGYVIPIRPHETLSARSKAIMLRYARMSEKDLLEEDTRINAEELLRMCGGLPVSLAIVGKGVRMLSVSYGGEKRLAWDKYLRTLQACREDLTSRSVDGYSNLAVTFSASLTLLEERRHSMPVPTTKSFAEMHKALCVLKKQGLAPVGMLRLLWKVESDQHAAFIARELVRFGLAEASLERIGKEYHEFFQLHDVIHDYAISQANPFVPAIHDELLSSYCRFGGLLEQAESLRQWWLPAIKPDYYIHGNLCRHLRLAKRASELVALLSKPEWVRRQLDISQRAQIEEDYAEGVLGLRDIPPETRHVAEYDLQLIAGAVKLSLPFTSENPIELCFQLHGRLVSLANSSSFIRDYLKRVEEMAQLPWLKPLDAYLAAPGGPLRRIVTLNDRLSCMCVSLDETICFCGSEEGKIYAIKLEGAFEVASQWTGHSSVVTGVSISRDGQTLVSSSWDSTAKVWDTNTGTNLSMFSIHGGDVNAVEMAPDNDTVLSASADDTVKVWKASDADKELFSFKQHYACVFCVRFAQNGQYAVSGGSDDEVMMWSVSENTHVHKRFPGHKQWVRCLALSSDGTMLATGAGSVVRIWNLDTNSKEPCIVLDACSGTLRDISFSRDGSRLVSGYSDNSIRVWDLVSGDQLGGDLISYSDSVMGVRLIANGKVAISTSWDGTLRVWDLTDIHTWRPRRSPHAAEVTCVSLSQDGEQLVSGAADGGIKMWEVTSGQQTGEEYPEAHQEGITGVEVTSDGNRLISTSLDKTLRILDRRTRKELAVMVGHERNISCMALSKDGKEAYTGSYDLTIRIWDLVSHDTTNPAILIGHTHWIRRLFVSEDGERHITTSGAEICIWSIKRRECLRFLCMEDAHVLSERDIFEAVGETWVRGKKMNIPLHGRSILWQENDERMVLGTLEADIFDWCFSPLLKTVCLGLASGQVAFFELLA